MTTKMLVRFGDLAGDDLATETFYLPGTVTDPTTGVPASLQTDLEAISNAAIKSVVLLPTDNTVVGSAVGAVYGSIEDKMTLHFKSATGAKVRFSFPAPVAACFKPNTDEVDPAQADVAALIASLQSNAKSTDGAALTFVKGKRDRTKTHKRK